MAQVKAADDSTDEATKFNSEAHIQFFKQVLPIFGVNLNDWCICLIADNTSVNKKIYRELGKPMVGCISHKLQLDVSSMVNVHEELQEVLSSIHSTMIEARTLKNAAILRNLTPLTPLIPNETRLTGKVNMFTRFLRIREDLVAVSKDEESTISIDASPGFHSQVLNFKNMLSEIAVVTKSLQTRGRTLAQCRDDIDVLMESVEQDKRKLGTALYQCKLKFDHLNSTTSFERGIVKLQQGDQGNLTRAEKSAVSMLQNNSEFRNRNAQLNLSEPANTTAERLAKRRRVSIQEDDYMNCYFVLGSVAEVERLFSMAKYLFSENRRRMTHQLFEAMCFLKENYDL